ncbi:uncharacterized protein LOC124166968 isoform X2 [Ischnura elegans]|uniref:uncharacterized protein LOC124166968 isoform X2 n=1 Tax=Ischnura elegans TaxID=197161 RepID=UPI001ED87E20|nr:uncharacterized protein LOC124166968 isoform X2 [Ischnura elegans]
MLTLRKYSVCRLCLCASHRLMDIFEDDCGVEFSLTEALNDLLRIEVDNTNGLPWQICSSCLDKLADFRLFKRRCWECKVTFESRLQSAVHLLDNSGKVQPPVVSLKNTNGGIQGEQIMQIAHVRGLVRVSKDLFPKNEISAQNNMHFAPEERENSTDFKDQEKSCEGVADGKNTLPPGNCHLVTENDAYPIQKGEEEAFHVTLEPIVEVPIKNVLVQRCNDEKEVEGKKSVESVHAESPCLCPLQLGSSVEPPSRKLRPARVRRKPFWACDDLPSMVARKRKNDGIVEENFMPASPVKGLVSVNKELVADSETSQNNVDVVTEGSKKLSQCDDIIENSCDREINLKTSQIFAKKESNCDITADSGAQSKEEKELVSQFKLKTLKILLDSLPPSILSEAANNLSPKKTPEHAAPEEITCTPETTSNEGFHSPSSRCVFSGEMFLPLEQKDKHVLDEENSIFCSEYTYQQARESKSSTMAARRLLEGVFTLAALQACSISGKPPRGKGRAAYNEGANIKPCLCPKAVNAIVVQALKFQDILDWYPKKDEKLVRQALSVRIHELSRK